ncbi:MAG: hypothetical protein ACYDD5_01035 [Sulfuricurvum sp.]
MIQLCRPTDEDTRAMGFIPEVEYLYMVVIDDYLVYWFKDLSQLANAIDSVFAQAHPIVISPESLILEVSSLEELQTLYPEYLI